MATIMLTARTEVTDFVRTREVKDATVPFVGARLPDHDRHDEIPTFMTSPRFGWLPQSATS